MINHNDLTTPACGVGGVWLLLLRVAVGVALVGCAAERVPLVAAGRVAQPELVEAHALAPDYVARVNEALQAAEAASSPEVRDDERQRAAWLRDAALAEAERIASLREVSRYEQRIERAIAERAEHERARLVLSGQQLRAAEAQRSQAEAVWVFAALSRPPPLRVDERERVGSFLVQRGQALLAAARVLGAAPALVEQAGTQLTAAVAAEPGRRVVLGRGALQAAARALGSARVQRPTVDRSERDDLLLGLRERGFDAQARASGCEIDLGSPADASRRLPLLGELLPAFPHGPIVITCGPRAGCDGFLWLPAPERARIQRDNTGALASGELRVVLPAYAEPAADTRTPAN